MNVTAALAETILHVKEMVVAMKDYDPSTIYESDKWDELRRHKFQPELVHRIRDGTYPEGDGLCDDIFRLAGGLDPSEMSNVESTAWHACTLLVLGNASISDRSTLINTSSLPGVGWFVRHAVSHGETLADALASRAIQSFTDRQKHRNNENVKHTNAFFKLLNISLKSERRNLRTAWQTRPDRQVGLYHCA
jgi:hypothetical protein